MVTDKTTNTKTENKNASPMIAQYLAIKEAHKDYILFYRMGDFYELFFDDAVIAAEALDITLTKRGKYDGKDIPMCGVPVHAHENYLARLIKKGFKVAVGEQLENPAEAKKRGYKAIVKRDVVRIITSGTLTEDTLLDARKHNYLTAVSEIKGKAALAWVDVSTGDFFVQKVDKLELSLSAMLARIEPKELLVPDKLLQNTKLFEILGDWKSVLSPMPSARFNSTNALIRLKKLFEVESLDAFGNFSNVEISAAGVLIDYIELTQKGQMPMLRPLRQIGKSAVMEIDAATRRNLELTRPLFTEYQEKGAKAACLLSVIDFTVTGSGARLLMQRLSSPLTEPSSINERLDMVGFFVEHEAVRNEIRGRLKLCPDIERSLTRLAFGRGGARDLAAIRDSLKQIPSLRIAVSCSSDGEMFNSQPESLLSCVKELGHHETLTDKLEKALDAELPVLIRDGGFIAPNYHAGLDELRKLRDESKRLINILQHRYANETGVSSLKIRFNNMLGYFIEVPSRHGNKLLSEGSNFIHRQTMASNVRFTTVELSELENRIRGAAEKALALELQIFSDLVKEVLSRSEEIARAARSLAVLDVSSSLAELAVKKSYCRPVIDESLAFEIKDGRHPVVEAALEADLESSFVSNNCVLGKNGNDTDKRLWLVTGPNMAGKSTFLRQNALIAILAQMGAYVPASFAHIGVVDRLFSRVGAADDLARGRSTFMVEMVETAVILNQATERSLVILDEIGRGTATFDGLSIAWATIEHLHEINQCRTLFATHYHELTTLASRLENLSLHCMRVKEWHGDVVFLHEIGAGTADRSYGIHVAKLAGLPKTVVKRAEKVLESLETGEQSSAITKLSDDLPLFIAAKEQIIITESQSSELKEALKEINPDEMTPKQAMEALYELKSLEE